MSQIAIFPGTFDPITYGHQDLIGRAADIFKQVIVAVAENKTKRPTFVLQERVAMVSAALQELSNVEVQGFSNLLVDFARANNATVLVRGVRSASDFEQGLRLASMNRSIDPSLETVLLLPTEKYAFISSTLVKELAAHNGDISAFVNPQVASMLRGIKWP